MDYDQYDAPDMAFGANLYDDASPDILGVPNAQADFWDMQEFADNCEPTAESFIIRQFGYDNISTNDFAYISNANGWYQPGGGTSPDDIGNMMDMFGIENHTYSNASIENLASELMEGHGVIVGVRADQLWEQGPLQELWNWLADIFGFDNPIDQPADHAVCVTGIDMSDPDNPMVILNDPGHPNGQGASYPLDRFMDAWENSNFVMNATNDPLPAFTAQNEAIRDSISQYLANNDIALPSPNYTVAAEPADLDLNGIANSVHEFTTPVTNILQDIAGIIGAIAGVVVAGNLLDKALDGFSGGDDFAYSL